MKETRTNITVEAKPNRDEIEVHRIIGKAAVTKAPERQIVRVDLDQIKSIPYVEGVPQYDINELKAA